MRPIFLVIYGILSTQLLFANGGSAARSHSFLTELGERRGLSRVTGFSDTSHVVVHLGYQYQDYADTRALEQRLRVDIGSRPVDAVHVFYLTSKGIASALYNIFIDDAFKDHGQILVVIPGSGSDELTHATNKIPDLYQRNKSRYRHIQLDAGHEWKDFIQDFVVRVSQKTFLEMKTKTEVLLKEGGHSELEAVLDIVTRSRFQKRLGEIDVELGMGLLPARGGKEAVQLAATNLVSLSKPINQINRYVNFSPLLFEVQEDSKFTTTDNLQLIEDQVSSFRSGRAHQLNRSEIFIEDLEAEVVLTLEEKLLTVDLFGLSWLYQYLANERLEVDIKFSNYIESKDVAIVAEDWEKVPFGEGLRLTAEIDLEPQSLGNLSDLKYEVSIFGELYESPRVGGSPFDRTIDNIKLIPISQEQISLHGQARTELIKSEVEAVAEHIKNLKSASKLVDPWLMPRNDSEGKPAYYPKPSVQKFANQSAAANAVNQYIPYLFYLNGVFKDESEQDYISANNCVSIFSSKVY